MGWKKHMIKIAVVDDEKEERECLHQYCDQFQNERKKRLEIREYTSGDLFLEEFDGSTDLIFLDIDMEGTNGIDTARRIREKDKDVLIMFVTNLAQMAIKGYEVRALDFIIKPVNYYSFAMKMQNALDIIETRKVKNIVITTAGGMQIISTEQLLYVEVEGHYLHYHTTEGIYQQKISLKELEESLAGLSFKRCNNCYLVNLKYVNGVEKEDVIIRGERLKISRPRKKEFLQALANYMGGIEI